MAASHVQHKAVTSTDNSLTHVITMNAAASSSANVLVVGVAVNDNTLTGSSVTSVPSQTWSVEEHQNDGGGVDYYLFKTTNALSTSSAHVITITSGSLVFWSGGASEDSNIGATKTTGATGAGTSSPVTATTASSLNANDICYALIEVNDNTATQGISDPPTGGTGTWVSMGAQQATNAHTGFEFAYNITGTGGTQSATWAFNTADSRQGSVVGYISAAGATSRPIFPAFPQALLNF